MNAARVVAASILAAALTAAHAQPREAGWELRVPERIEVAAGQAAPLELAIAVDRGLTVSKDAAVIVDLDLESGASVKKKRLGRGDAVDPGADAPRFAVSVRGEAPGEHPVRVRIRFWLCGARSCRPIDVRKVATVVVTEPAGSGISGGRAGGPAGS